MDLIIIVTLSLVVIVLCFITGYFLGKTVVENEINEERIKYRKMEKDSKYIHEMLMEFNRKADKVLVKIENIYEKLEDKEEYI